jgi:futalosine hydrolase
VRILIVAATAAELDPCLSRMKASAGVDVLVTGVGMVATAVQCAQALALQKYDFALNLGVCGSFDPSLQPPTTVHVVTDCIAELGAEDGERFLSVQELRLLGDDEFPFHGGRLVNDAPPVSAALRALPAVHGITVNTVHGNDRSIEAAVRRFHPQVESMEGAAFMYACLVQGVPFAQVRAVSNVVERRNRGAWKLKEAIDNLNATALEIIDHL